MGKRVLRPGGLELTQRLLDELFVTPDDDVVEFAPGLGVTAQLTLSRRPRSYTAIERDAAAAAAVEKHLEGPNQHCVLGTAEETGLPAESATVVYGEAMVSMHPATTKARIVGEAIRHALSDEIHVGVRPLTIREWRELLTAAGLVVTAEHTAPMHLLEPVRLTKDEGFARALRFVWNVATHSAARRRVMRMRSVFRKYGRHPAAIVLVGEKGPLNRQADIADRNGDS